MTARIVCYTLFNINATGVINRATRPVGVTPAQWIKDRNTQCNYDTLLQIISLRSQPEELSRPSCVTVTQAPRDIWGTHYRLNKNSLCWRFEFTVSHSSVFNDGVHELGTLWRDSAGVPMVLVDDNIRDLRNVITTTSEYRNIHWSTIAT